ncbi:MAG TPA: hypothetical protein VHK25_07420, partial [Acidimicrobiales bacterium]|nr:hypothetical protein [Acidimicrobiales bacterium]
MAAGCRGSWRARRTSGRRSRACRAPQKSQSVFDSRRWGPPRTIEPTCARQRGPQVKVGVLALQGASVRHATMLSRLGVEPVACRLPPDLDDVDALVLPGGESTTMSMLLES